MRTINIKINLLTFYFFWLIYNPVNLYAEIVDRVIAKVNDEIITLSDIKEIDMPILENEGSNVSNENTERQLIDLIINKKIQLKYAIKAGVDVSHEEINSALQVLKQKNSLTDDLLQVILQRDNITMTDYENSIKEQLIISKLTNMEVRTRILIEEYEIEDYYEQHKEDFTNPKEVRVRNIMLACCNGLGEEEIDKVVNKAKRILEMAKNGEDFTELAVRYSEGPNAAEGGDMGTFKQGTILPELEEVVFNMKEGDISDIIRTRLGLHILKVDEIKEKRYIPLNQVSELVEQQLFIEKFRKKYESWLEELRNEYYIEITL